MDSMYSYYVKISKPPSHRILSRSYIVYFYTVIIRRFLLSTRAYIFRALSIGQAEPLVTVYIKYIYRTIPPGEGEGGLGGGIW
jgi:hypothetical protein